MRISIVIPVFNRSSYTIKTLNDLLSTNSNEIEIIIVNNASTDDTHNKLMAMKEKKFKYILNGENKGFGFACNQGYEKSRGEIVCFLNNDIKISDKENWFGSIYETLENYPDSVVSPTAGFVDPKNNFQFCYETQDTTKKFNYLSGWCISARRETWEKLKLEGCGGPFDSKSFFCYFEDSDLGFRATSLDIPLKLIRLPVQHIGKISSSQLNTLKLYTESRKIFINKWKDKIK